jgi:linoleoyl-CoA desaturase
MIYKNEQTNAKTFKEEVYQSINDYFKENHLSKHANYQMHVKLWVGFSWWLLSFILLFTVSATKSGFFGLYIFHVFSQLFILLNISHDANHNSISKNKKINRWLSYSFDLCGVNSYMWRELHHAHHHYCINISGEDENLVARGLFRFTKRAKFKFFHKFQHIYFFILYGLFSADYILTKDFECFFLPYTKYLKEKKHPAIEYIKLFLFKFCYIGYMILLPVIYLHYSWFFIIGIFFICHFMIGIIAGTVIQITHPLRANEFPQSRNEYDNFVFHVFATTSDYSEKSTIANWFFGGLHLHVIHHLSPAICHTHYAVLTERIKLIAEKHKVVYKSNRTMLDAIKEHYYHLQNLSKNNINLKYSE